MPSCKVWLHTLSEKQRGWGMQCSNHPHLLKHLVHVLQCCQTDTPDKSKMELVSLITVTLFHPRPVTSRFFLELWSGQDMSAVQHPLPAKSSASTSVTPLPPPCSLFFTAASWASRGIPEGRQRTRAGPVLHQPFLLLLDLALAIWDWRVVPVLSYLPYLTAQKQQGRGGVRGDQSNEVGSTRDGREKEHKELKIRITIKCTIVTMYCAVLLS